MSINTHNQFEISLLTQRGQYKVNECGLWVSTRSIVRHELVGAGLDKTWCGCLLVYSQTQACGCRSW